MRQAGKWLLCLAIVWGGMPFVNDKTAHADSAIEPQLVSGYYHSIGLASDGTVWTWGGNDKGQLGNGRTANVSAPVAPSGMSGVSAIAGGVRSTYALKNDGTVWAWGLNENGQLGDGTTTNREAPVQIAGLTGVIAISGGLGYHALARKGDGTVMAWGRNDNGELGDGTTTQRSAPVQVPGLSDVAAVASGGYFSLALKEDGTVWAWGVNNNGELGDGTTMQRTSPVAVAGLSGVVAIAAGGSHSLALKGDGTVWAWGQNGYGTLGDGTTTNRTRPVQVTGMTNVTAIAGGGYHSLALKSDGTVWAWGQNGQGQLGDGTTTQRLVPVQATGLSNVRAIAAGGFHSMAMRDDGYVWGWGYNGYGQLADRTWTQRLIPTQGVAVLDTTLPTVSDGAIAVSGLTATGTTLSWTPATDNMTEQGDLQYAVYRSVRNNIDTVSRAESNGTAIGGYAANIATLPVTGLAPSTTYYFNVIVKDEAGRKSAYRMQPVTTKAVYAVRYDGNGSNSGSAPADNGTYEEGATAVVLGNTGDLVRPGYTFAGWNTQADGRGRDYAAGDALTIGTESVVLYARWTANPTYTVSFDGNGSSDGEVPPGAAYEEGATVPVPGNTGGLLRPGYTFVGWNTQADGRGTDYAANGSFRMTAENVILYAKWTANPTYTVSYDGNGAASGNAPDAGAYEEGTSVTVASNSGHLARPGYVFAGWNTADDGNGRSYATGETLVVGTADITLFAVWMADAVAPTTVSYAPAHGATGVPVDTRLELTFSERVFAAAGKSIAIRDAADGSIVETIAAADPARVAITGATVAISLAAALSSGTEYYVTVDEGAFTDEAGNRHAGITDAATWSFATARSSDATLSALRIDAGGEPALLSPAFARNVADYSAGVPSAWAAVAVTASVYERHAGVTANVYNGAGAHVLGPLAVAGGQAMGPLPLAVGGNRIELAVQAQDGTTKMYTVTVTRAAPPSDEQPDSPPDGDSPSESPAVDPADPSGGSSPSTPPGDGAGQASTGLTLLVNGRPHEQMATSAVASRNGRTVVTANVDAAPLAEALATEREGASIVIAVTLAADEVSAVLTGDAVKAMENKRAVLEVRTLYGVYRLPAAELGIDRLARQLGQAIPLADIVVRADIAKSGAVPREGSYAVVAAPVSFTVTASSSDGNAVEVDKFGAYVERDIPLPDGVDPSEVTTAAVLAADGTIRHVPTRIVVRDGRYAAAVNSLTNSAYLLIAHRAVMADVAGHWAQAAVDDMASRLVVNGVADNRYEPDAAIARAAFAAVVVRALGLADDGTTAAYADVSPGDWYMGAVAKAREYGLADGYEDGTFRPEQTITREEAMAIVARAMKLAGLEASAGDAEAEAALSRFADGAAVSGWAKGAVAALTQSRLVEGDGDRLLPKSSITRAETAVIVRRLLQQAGLIDGADEE